MTSATDEVFHVFEPGTGNTNKTDPYYLWGIDNYTKDELFALRDERDAGRPERILSICVSTTAMCNVRCWYCYALANKSRNPHKLSQDEYRRMIHEAAELGAKTMIICGDGEPTYDPDLLPILECGANLGMLPVLVTNGTIMGDDRIASQLHGMTGRELTQEVYDRGASLLVKLETLKPALYEQMLAVEGIWEKFMVGVANICEAGFGNVWEDGKRKFTRLSFTGICTRQNRDEVPLMLAWARERGGQYICKVPSPTGGALDHKDDYLFSPNEIPTVRDWLGDYTDKRETLTPIVLDEENCMTCMAWHLGPVISEDGYYVECYTSTATHLGSIREKSLKDLLLSRTKDNDFTSPCPIKDRLYTKLLQINKNLVPEGHREYVEM